jgi:hypothetical protein
MRDLRRRAPLRLMRASPGVQDPTMTTRFVLALLLAAAPFGAHAYVELALGLADNIEEESEAGVASLAWITAHENPYEFLVGHIESRRDPPQGRLSPTATFVSASKRFTWKRWYASSGIALTDTDTDNRVLSGTLQFLTTVGWGGKRWSISMRHLSNAGIEGRNHGETYLMLAYRF